MKDAKDNELEPGDRVKFVGFNAKSHETVGKFTGKIGGYAKVEWDARPQTSSPIHPSQIEKIL